MQLTKSDDIEAPRAAVFAALADVDHWERAALRRGVELQRTDRLSAPAPGMAWRLGFAFRGKRRQVDLHVTAIDPGQADALSGAGAALDGTARIDLAELSPRRTRMTVALDIGARTLAARLFLQSLRLAQGRIRQRFDTRVAMLAQDIETRLRGAPRL